MLKEMPLKGREKNSEEISEILLWNSIYRLIVRAEDCMAQGDRISAESYLADAHVLNGLREYDRNSSHFDILESLLIDSQTKYYDYFRESVSSA